MEVSRGGHEDFTGGHRSGQHDFRGVIKTIQVVSVVIHTHKSGHRGHWSLSQKWSYKCQMLEMLGYNFDMLLYTKFRASTCMMYSTNFIGENPS